jgi:hypothetical protein
VLYLRKPSALWFPGDENAKRRNAMKSSSTLFYAGLGAILLTGCGGANVSAPFAPAPNCIPGGKRVLKVLQYAGKPQEFVVPSGIKCLTIDAKGAGGTATGPDGGLGAAIEATISVQPGETLAVYVGGTGTSRAGGYNGGGKPGSGGGGGGGASDLRERGDTIQSRVVVAGGGGGAGAGAYYSSRSIPGGTGGNGGKAGHSGGAGGSSSYGQNGGGGNGGSQTAGGSGGKAGFCSICYAKHESAKHDSYGGCDGSGGASGTLGRGGDGGSHCDEAGGGGGGGYYGGGGGGSSAYSWVYEYPSGYSYNYGAGGGGGGGSSYAEKSAVDVKYQAGARSGNGLVVVSTP